MGAKSIDLTRVKFGGRMPVHHVQPVGIARCRRSVVINRYLPGDHALVLGASVAGMLAARALSDFFETVTVVERDQLPGIPESRRGVPQGRHAHLLWARGIEVLDQLFPGLSHDLVTDGAPVFDGEDLSQVYLHNGGYPLPATGRFRDFQLVLPTRLL